MDFADYLEGQIRDWMSQGSAMPTPPGSLWVALHTTAPGESPDGSTEVGAGDYDRSAIPASTGWNTPTANSFDNANEINFGEATSDWGTLEATSLWDGPDSADNPLAAFNLDSTIPVLSGDTFKFNAGDLDFSVD